MKRFLLVAVLATATVPAFAADIGVSINIGQPGFYGQIDIGGGYPPPRILYREPRVIHPATVYRQPIYMHVPPGHSRNWKKHCRQYNACGERVYFVNNNWYQTKYVPHYQEQHRVNRDQRGHDHDDGHKNHKNNDKQGKEHGHKNDHGSNR